MQHHHQRRRRRRRGSHRLGRGLALRPARAVRGRRRSESRNAGAWHTAAGMLAPMTELHYAETPLLRLSLDSLARYPGFAAELSDLTGRPTRVPRVRHTLGRLGRGRSRRPARRCTSSAAGSGLDATLLTGRELRELEPALEPGPARRAARRRRPPGRPAAAARRAAGRGRSGRRRATAPGRPGSTWPASGFGASSSTTAPGWRPGPSSWPPGRGRPRSPACRPSSARRSGR